MRCHVYIKENLNKIFTIYEEVYKNAIITFYGDDKNEYWSSHMIQKIFHCCLSRFDNSPSSSILLEASSWSNLLPSQLPIILDILYSPHNNFSLSVQLHSSNFWLLELKMSRNLIQRLSIRRIHFEHQPLPINYKDGY